MAIEIKKMVIPTAGLGTRFLPLSRVLAKAILPVGDEPMVALVVQEAKMAGADEVIFVLSEKMKVVLDYFKPKPKLAEVLSKRKCDELLSKLKQSEKILEGINFSSVVQPEPKGDGDAILKVKKQVGKDPFAVLFHDDLFLAKTPAISQLIKVFQTSQKPVIGLKKVSEEKLPSYGVVAVEKVANRLYQIKKIIEKPKQGEAPSDLAICGRYVLTPDIFHYLAKTPQNQKGELILAEVFKMMIDDGKIIYGWEIDGDWLECGKIIDWLKTSIFLTLQHQEYGPVIKEWLKKAKLF